MWINTSELGGRHCGAFTVAGKIFQLFCPNTAARKRAVFITKQPPHQMRVPGISRFKSCQFVGKCFTGRTQGVSFPCVETAIKSPRGSVLAKCHSEPETLFLLKIIMPHQSVALLAAILRVFAAVAVLFRRKLTPPDNFTDFPVFQGIVRRH